jgi:hypothetical protein
VLVLLKWRPREATPIKVRLLCQEMESVEQQSVISSGSRCESTHLASESRVMRLRHLSIPTPATWIRKPHFHRRFARRKPVDMALPMLGKLTRDLDLRVGCVDEDEEAR